MFSKFIGENNLFFKKDSTKDPFKSILTEPIDPLGSVPGLPEKTQLVSLKLPDNNLTDLKGLPQLDSLYIENNSDHPIA